MGIDPKFISPYNQATGGVERMNPTVLCILWKVCLRGKALSLCDGSIGNQNDGVNNDWNDAGWFYNRAKAQRSRWYTASYTSIWVLINEHHYDSEMSMRLTKTYEAVAAEIGAKCNAYKKLVWHKQKMLSNFGWNLVLLHWPIDTTRKRHTLQHSFRGPYRVNKVTSEHNTGLRNLQTGEQKNGK